MSITQRMDKTIDSLKHHLSSLRTNRANPEMLNSIMVDYYGAPTPLQQVAAVTAPENMVLMLNIFDSSAVKNVEKAIQTSQLGLNPQTDGNVIRIRLPELTEERRREIIKVVKTQAEEARVSIRNIRRDEIEDIKKQEKNKEITEDESKREQQNIQNITDAKIKKIDSIAENKEKEILTI